jgi:hypothetical protein
MRSLPPEVLASQHATPTPLDQITPDHVRARIEDLDHEARALRALLRSLLARERAARHRREEARHV